MPERRQADPVVPDQAGRLMPIDPLGINASPEEIRRSFHLHQEKVLRRRAYEIWEQRAREDGHALDHWLQAERELEKGSEYYGDVSVLS